jgi:hypothetical protein
LRTACLRRQCITPAFAGLRRDVDEPPVPVAPVRTLRCRGSAADGTTGIVGDDVAALPRSDLEQFRSLSGFWLLHDRHLSRSVGSTEVECRDRDSRHLSPLLGDPNRRGIDDLPRPVAHAIACSDLGLVIAPMAHAEGTVPVADAAQKVRQIG